MSKAEKTARQWKKEMRKGYTKLAVLAFLNKKSLTGYDIMKEIEEETLGFWKLTSGGTYPLLKGLEQKGYIIGHWIVMGERKKKIYKITDDGRQLLEIALRKHQEITETIGELFRQCTKEILGTTLPTSPSILFKIPPFGGNLDKPIEERMRILEELRNNMTKAVEFIDKKLKKLEGSRLKKEGVNLSTQHVGKTNFP